MLNRMSLIEMSQALRNRDISPIDLVEAHLAEIERQNPKFNLFLTLLSDRARAAAKASQQRFDQDRPAGMLDGIPVSVKESFDLTGVPTTCGSKLMSAEPAASTAFAVERLEQGGAVILGKTNVPEMLRSYETDNHLAGYARNPWDPERTSGGSSGGEAAAIASFCSAGGIGTDGGGSVRIPAHFCGIAGLKATRGRISLTGHHPNLGPLAGLMDAAGPMARSVADLQVVFGALAGYDLDDPATVPLPVAEPDLENLTIGVMEQFLDVPVQPAMREAVRRSRGLLSGIGFRTDAFRPTGIETAPNVWLFFFAELGVPQLRKRIAGREAELHWTLLEVLEKPLPEPSMDKLNQMMAERDRLRTSLARQMETHRLLLLPVCGVSAFRPRERKWPLPEKSLGLFQAAMPAIVFNAVGFPALAVPMGTDEAGLPVGVQLVARPYEDELLLEVGKRLEQARGPLKEPSI